MSEQSGSCSGDSNGSPMTDQPKHQLFAAHGVAAALRHPVLRRIWLATLLSLCFVVGSGMALFGPAWQSSVSEQVPADTLPSAVALNGISYNIARSFGPAIGGIVVATAGAVAAFAANALLYIPLLIVLF